MRQARVADVLTAFEGAFERDGWHGPTVLEALAGVTARQAGQRPKKAHHSLHTLVDHIAYWEQAGLHYVTKAAPGPDAEADWTKPRSSYAASVRTLKATHRRLVQAVARLRDADLDRIVETEMSGRLPLAKVLHGIAAHAAYHAGQLRLLRTLV